MIKFAVYPGYVYSINDGDRHFISARELMRLHNIRPEECIVIDPEGPRPVGYRQDYIDSLMPIRPRQIHYAPITETERSLLPFRTHNLCEPAQVSERREVRSPDGQGTQRGFRKLAQAWKNLSSRLD